MTLLARRARQNAHSSAPGSTTPCRPPDAPLLRDATTPAVSRQARLPFPFRSPTSSVVAQPNPAINPVTSTLPRHCRPRHKELSSRSIPHAPLFALPSSLPFSGLFPLPLHEIQPGAQTELDLPRHGRQRAATLFDEPATSPVPLLFSLRPKLSLPSLTTSRSSPTTTGDHRWRILPDGRELPSRLPPEFLCLGNDIVLLLPLKCSWEPLILSLSFLSSSQHRRQGSLYRR